MKIYLLAFLIPSVLLFQSCSSGNGNKVSGENLDIYFTDKKDEQKATELAFFWKENNLIGKRKQSLKLLKSKDNFLLYLICTEPEKLNELPIHEKNLLLDLQDSLNAKVFNPIPCNIYLCDQEFNPLININDF